MKLTAAITEYVAASVLLRAAKSPDRAIRLAALPGIPARQIVAAHLAKASVIDQSKTSTLRALSTTGPKPAEIERLEIAARPHLAVDLLMANRSGTPCPVRATSRRRRGPTASLDGAWRFAKLGYRDRRLSIKAANAVRGMPLMIIDNGD